MGRKLESLPCAPQELSTSPCLLPILPLLLWDGHSVSIQATGPGRTLHPQKITNSLTLHRAPLDPPSAQCPVLSVPSLPPDMSCLPHTAGVGPSHRPGQLPPDLIPHLAKRETTGLHLQPSKHTCNPIS